MQLTKGIFDRSVPRGEQPLFGLSTSQMRGNEIVHNGGWYNLAGEKLAWGDLAARDFVRILVEIPHGEAFIVLGEGASHWDFLRDFGGKPEAMALDPAAPGIDYVLEHMRWVIVSGVVYCVEDLHRAVLTIGGDWLGLRNYVVVARGWMIGELRMRGLLPPAPTVSTVQEGGS